MAHQGLVRITGSLWATCNRQIRTPLRASGLGNFTAVDFFECKDAILPVTPEIFIPCFKSADIVFARNCGDDFLTCHISQITLPSAKKIHIYPPTDIKFRIPDDCEVNLYEDHEELLDELIKIGCTVGVTNLEN